MEVLEIQKSSYACFHNAIKPSLKKARFYFSLEI